MTTRIFIIVYGLFRIEIAANQPGREKGRESHSNVGSKKHPEPMVRGVSLGKENYSLFFRAAPRASPRAEPEEVLAPEYSSRAFFSSSIS